MRHVGDEERRARIAVRHALAPAWRLRTPLEVTRTMTVLHATEAASVHLACRARAPSVTIADVDRALYEERTIVKQLAMRRTLFAFPRELLSPAWASTAARVARTEQTRMAADLVAAGRTVDGTRWLARARSRILAELAEQPDGLTAAELRTRLPRLAVTVEVAARSRNSWGVSQLLTWLGARGDIVRAVNAGGWRTSRPRWTLPRHWLGDPVPVARSADGYRELVRRWLHTFGPGTEDDIVWWLGATRGAVRAALAELDAVPVTLDGGVSGWLAADDLVEPVDPGPWVALLPVLDPTVMGWRGRDFYLGRHGARLFDNRGNAGTTAWVDGRIVGCWVQDPAGTVQLSLEEQIGARARRALTAEAAALTAWLGGEVVSTNWRSPAMTSALAQDATLRLD